MIVCLDKRRYTLCIITAKRPFEEVLTAGAQVLEIPLC
ncbi:MAG: hypothetical protein S4CHLAM102_12390 [Chlamydiia bacterium]|nr:hypothetical protein [Chlamydiia bacterium]